MSDSKDIINVGPWGARGGESWSFRTNGGKINKIIITSDANFIGSLEFGYANVYGYPNRSGPFGIPGGVPQEFNIEDDETLTAVSGSFNRTIITSLTFHTERNTYGPVGKELGSTFSLPVKDGAFEGFFGNIDHGLPVIGSFDVVLRP